MKRERALWLGVFFLLVAVVFLSYRTFLFSGFWEDDNVFLRVVPAFRPRDLPEFFSPVRGWFYRPVFLVYFSLLRRIFGDNPVAFHAAGFLVHALNLTLIAALIRRLAGRNRAVVIAIAATLLGLLLYRGVAAQGTSLSNTGISAVVWISSASTLLATLFSLLCLHLWLSFLRHGVRRYYIAALGTFFLALISKEDAATLPLALLILDFTFGTSRPMGHRLRTYAPFFLTFVLFAALDIVAYKHYQVFGSVGLGGPLRFARYRLAFDFLNAVLLYHWGSNALWILAGLAAIGVWGWRYDRASVFFWGWLCAAALPAPLMSGPHALASRFYYLPAFAATPAIALMARNLFDKKDNLSERVLVPLTLGAAVLALPARTWALSLLVDVAFVWIVMALLIVVAWVAKRSGHLPGALFAALVLSCLASQLDIYGPSTDFVGFWSLLCLPVAAVMLSVVARQEHHSPPGAWVALSLSWAQPAIYWLALAVILVCYHLVTCRLQPMAAAQPVTQ